MRDIVVPNRYNKENKTHHAAGTSSSSRPTPTEKSNSSLNSSSAKITIEMKTAVTPGRKDGFATPKITVSQHKSSSSTFHQKKTQVYSSTTDSSTPVGSSKNLATPSSAFKTPDLVRSNSVSQKRKFFNTPTSTKHPDTPIPKRTANQSLHASMTETEEECNVTVAVRVRPLNSKERTEGSTIKTGQDGLVTIDGADGSSLSFQYEHCFGPDSTQMEVFRDLVHPLLTKALEGYNACLFSYGQTGSGKTYSMMGAEVVSGCKVSREAGIIPRFGFSLFEKINRGKMNVSIEVSYFEIYNEKIRDLLSDDAGLRQAKPTLRVREHPQYGPYVENLTVQSVSSFESLQGWLRLGISRRATAASAMNDKSSRSHSIFTITLTQGPKRSKVHLVDLAGSERLVNTCATGDRLREGVRINTSLLTLGKVINALADKAKKTFVPYRDSMLTWILSDSLGGSARTVMLATVSPSKLFVEETLATLRYACQARTIVNRPQVQLQQGATPQMQRQLHEEMDRLRQAREEYEKRGAGREVQALQMELSSVRQKLRQVEEERSEWESRVKAYDLDRSRQLAELARKGVTTSDKPGLMLLTSDPSLSLHYALPTEAKPKLVFGSVQPPADVILDSPLVAENHCLLELKCGTFWLTPCEGCETFVNGTLVTQELPLTNRDRLALGGDVFLLLNLDNFNESETGTNAPLVDYEFARMELSLAQNARLNMELTSAKQKALMELEAKKAELEKLGASKDAAEAELELMRADQQKLAAALRAEIEAEKRRMELAMAPLDISIAPSYDSNFIQELKSLEQASTAPSGIGLHEMHCLVKEATQRCKQLGLPYRFTQAQKVNSGGSSNQSALQPCVKIRGKGRLSTVCTNDQFMDVLDTIRDCEGEVSTATDQLENGCLLEWCEDENDSSSSENSILVDMAPFRRPNSTPATTIDPEKCFAVMQETLKQLQGVTFKHPNASTYLKNVSDLLCQLERAYLHPEFDSFQSEISSVHSEKSNDTAKSDSWLSEALDRLRNTSVASSIASSAASTSTILYSPPSISAVPMKSNIRQPLADSPSKEVRFHIKLSRKRKSDPKDK
ncbi:kinesin-like protein KIF14 [Neocloeon triangulifer]|uniref:kinesin-like protein KIF14 n=1 Tax=Neocloeon triangulifer TaxID=2078957 RepID=UPI00286EF4DF|nr:kinesin-like protein KIF14 [Neocloeon triangulifer]